MATVTVYTAERMQEIEDTSVVNGDIDGSGHLILYQNDGTPIDAGSIRGSFDAATETVAGIVELATIAETETGTDTTRAVTPAGVAAVVAAGVPDASDTVKGKVELATNAEAITGTSIVLAVTPANLAAAVTTHVSAASDTVAGKVELATTSEATAQSDTTRAVTPAGLADRAKLASPTFTGTVTTDDVVVAGRLSVTPDSLTDASTIAIDASTGNFFTVTLGGNRTLGNPTNAVDGQKLLFRIRQDGTGTRTLTLDTKYRLGTDITSTTLTTTINKTDYIGVVYHASDDKFDVIAMTKGY